MGKINNRIKYVVASFLLVAVVIIANVFYRGVFALDVSIERNGSRLITKTGDFEGISYQWKISSDGLNFENINDATEKFYDLKPEDSGKTIKVVVDGEESGNFITVGKVVVMDIGKGAITLGTNYSGKDSDGNAVNGPHDAGNIYIITHKDNSAFTTNNIYFSGNLPNAPFNVTLEGVNMGATPTNHSQAPGSSGVNTPSSGKIEIPATNSAVKKVTIYLKDENIVRYICYYNGGDTQTPASVNSYLKFTDINGDGEVSGSLYVPVKLSADEIEAFVKTNTNYNHWNAGIGGTDGSSLVQNLHIAGGRIQVVTTLGDNCTAIGAGGNGYCQMEISGGEVIAHCNGTGAAIGGGIGWNAAGGPADITISGGKIYAKNHAMIESGADIVGGVAIGSGSSFHAAGSNGTVIITGGTVEAYGTFGNGIGGGNSSTSTGGNAAIGISGNANVTATSIGGGNSKVGSGGDADVVISDSANVELIKGIGGGSSDSGNGGDATITVISGTINCGDVIGGGNGGGTGNGGKATIKVIDGVLTSKSIGGGTGSEGGNGGAADITISGGLIETGSIGGGTTKNHFGSLGYAKAFISGGEITGQFLLYAAGDEQCSFEMTGGILHDVNTSDPKYAIKDGAAVYMNDPKGIVKISGGTITNCSAENGGAVYMTEGTFELSGEGSISGNNASVNGGAIYLGGGTVTINGGTVSGNKAEVNGGGAYLENGTFIVKGGTVSGNDATGNGGGAYLGGGVLTIDGGTVSLNSAENGGGAFVNGGEVRVYKGAVENNIANVNGGGFAVNNGNFGMTGGYVNGNSAKTGNGGGIYVSASGADVVVDVLSGSVSGNSAAKSGGALSVIGNETGSDKIDVTIGVNKLHFDAKNNEEIVCEHGDKYGQSGCTECPETENNKAGEKGGAFFVTGNNQTTTLNIYCLTESGSKAEGENGQSDFMKVEGGRVLVSTTTLDESKSDEENEQNQNDYSGNISINSSIYVTGGDFDIWGEMINPDIKNVITVDIIDADTDEFDDHRQNSEDASDTEKFYKLLYYENFKDPETGKTTGQYKEYMISHGTAVEILGNIYVHPGYQIVGWNTEADTEDMDMTKKASQDDNAKLVNELRNGWYEVGKSYQFNGHLRGDITIYAIWEANGYTVRFDPNIPAGQPYDGNMVDQIHTYNVKQKLSANQFTRPGYEFDGWNTKADGTGSGYTDEQEVENLTTKENELVILYAQWKECDHNKETHVYTYSSIENGKGIKRECSCKGYSETVVLSASDTVYDKNEHPAEKSYSVSGWDHVISYTKQDDDSYDGSVPKNAGTYAATIIDNGITASVTYTIEKAEQPAPPKPEFEIGEDTKSLSVKQVAESELKATDPQGYDSVREYMLVYYDANGIERRTEWVAVSDDITSGNIAHTFSLDFALTNYSIYARYSEGKNYKASPEIKANGKYFYAGNVVLIVNGGEGVNYIQKMADGKGDSVTENGIQIDIELLEGYYFPQDYDNGITMTAESSNNGTLVSIPELIVTDAYKQYKIGNISENCIITVTLPDAVKAPSIKANITEKQVFEAFTDDKAIISRDSAFTVGFEIYDFNPEDYTGLTLDFGIALPFGTKIIVQNRDPDHFAYYSDVVDTEGGKSEFNLADFGRMGVKYADPNDPEHKFELYKGNMLLNVIVDFSGTKMLPEDTEIQPYLIAEAKALAVSEEPEQQAEGEPKPQIGPFEIKSNEDSIITAELKKEAVFELAVEDKGLSKKITYNYSPSEGVASVWDNKDTAIVIRKSEDENELPADTHIVFAKDTYKVEAYPNSNGEFIFPIMGPESGTVEVYLVSDFMNGKEYKMDIFWKTADSIAETAPINGDLNCAEENVVFKGRSEIYSSIKVIESNNIRLFSIDGDLTFTAYVEWKNFISSNAIEIALLKKIDREDGSSEYVDTGFKWNARNEVPIGNKLDEGSYQISVVLPKERGSYCVRIRLLEGLIFISEANYYFIID